MQTRKQEEIDRCIKFGEALNPFKLIIDVAKLIGVLLILPFISLLLRIAYKKGSIYEVKK